MMKDGGGYAFSSEHPYPEGGPGATKWYTGMTMRQWYKGQALAGVMFAKIQGLGYTTLKDGGTEPNMIAGACAWIAEAMIAEDKKAEEGDGGDGKE